MSGGEGASRDQSFPWRQAMAIGLGVLRLSPRDFWSMTPRELEAAFVGLTQGGHPVSPMSAAELDALMKRHPDQEV